MKIIGLTDIHGRLNSLIRIEKKLAEADLILIAGDITNFGDGDKAEEVISSIERYNKNILAVYGNCDYPSVESYLSQKGYSISWKHKEIGDYTFIGVGGSLSCPARTPSEFPESEFSTFFRSILNDFSSGSHPVRWLVLVSHQPPKNTICDRAHGGVHVGSSAVRQFIEDAQPVFVLTGHIHEGRGVDRIGNTIVVNPGPFRTGNYAEIEVDDGKLKSYSIYP